MKKEPYKLPEADCRHMTRTELNALLRLICTTANAAYLDEDLKEWLRYIPGGIQRAHMALGQLRSLIRDMKGTLKADQKRRVDNACQDNELRIVPRQTPEGKVLAMDRKEARVLIDAAQESKCLGCVKDSISCRNCDLYKVLVAYVPLDDYKGENCPYGMRVHDWRDS